MKKNADARQRILDAAADLFHRQGVHATGLDLILEESGTGKGQFYHYFENKDDLIHHVMRDFFARLKSGAVPVNHRFTTWRDLELWFQFFIDAQKAVHCERSCPIGTIGAELTDQQRRLRADACEIFDFTRESIAEGFRHMQKTGLVRKNVDAASLADFCFSIMQGGLLVAKIERSSAPFENAARHALAYLKSFKA